MNKKTREVLQELVNFSHRAYINGAAFPGFHTAISNAEKLLNPPVRFLWTAHWDTVNGAYYCADIGSNRYLIKKQKEGWVISINGSSYSTRKTLIEAKQACVDYGVSNAKAKRVEA
jgi:hypothetical protein